MSNIFRLFQETKIEDSIDPASRTIVAVAEIMGSNAQLARNELHPRMSEAMSTSELLTHAINQLEAALEATVQLFGTIVEPGARATFRDQIGSARKELRAARRRTEYLKGVS
jgi:TATA-binding protein-associated factor Taf7